jgi:gas vesicle protein
MFNTCDAVTLWRMSKLPLSKLALGVLLNAAVEFLTWTDNRRKSTDSRHSTPATFSNPSATKKTGEHHMVNTHEQVRMGAGVLIAGALGAIVGAGLALLYAPQAGKKTQAAIRREAIQLKKQVGKRAEGLYAAAEGLASDTAERVNSLTEHGREFVEEKADTLKKVLAR